MFVEIDSKHIMIYPTPFVNSEILKFQVGEKTQLQQINGWTSNAPNQHNVDVFQVAEAL